VPSDGLVGTSPQAIVAQRRLVESLDGTFHTVIGEDKAAAVVDFATGVNATMIVVGVPRHSRWQQLLVGSTALSIAQLAGSVDVHMVSHEAAGRGVPTRRAGALSGRRRLCGWALGALGPLLLTWLLGLVHNDDSLPTELMSFLALTVAVALVGGLSPSLLSAVVGLLLVNYFFVPPMGRLTVATPANLLALVVYVATAIAVASVVGVASRRTTEAARARSESVALASLSTSVLSGSDTAQALVERLRETFGLTSVALLQQDADAEQWTQVAAGGTDPATGPDEADTVIKIDEQRLLALRGRVLPASDRRVLEAFAAQAGLVLEYRRLRERDAQAAVLEHGESLRAALLTAVSHDLRTPLATIRASVDVLLSPGVELAVGDTDVLTHQIQVATGQLERLIDNLLDLSRLQSGMLQPALRPTGLDEVVPIAVSAVGADRVALEMDDVLPLVLTDAGLLERVVANVLSNAVRHAPDGERVRVTALATRDSVELRVADTGPGVSAQLRQDMFEPFQRLGDTSPDGLGLGLAVAKGLAEAVGVSLTPEDTPGGGLTMIVAVPTAPTRPPGPARPAPVAEPEPM
jgi:two-component system sensor histidine kinase KdpD